MEPIRPPGMRLWLTALAGHFREFLKGSLPLAFLAFVEHTQMGVLALHDWTSVVLTCGTLTAAYGAWRDEYQKGKNLASKLVSYEKARLTLTLEPTVEEYKLADPRLPGATVVHRVARVVVINPGIEPLREVCVKIERFSSGGAPVHVGAPLQVTHSRGNQSGRTTIAPHARERFDVVAENWRAFSQDRFVVYAALDLWPQAQVSEEEPGTFNSGTFNSAIHLAKGHSVTLRAEGEGALPTTLTIWINEQPDGRMVLVTHPPPSDQAGA